MTCPACYDGSPGSDGGPDTAPEGCDFCRDSKAIAERVRGVINEALERGKKLNAFTELEAAIRTCQAHGDTEVSLGWLVSILERNR